jgi:ribonuclease J
VRILPLGGVGEIGKNCLVVECDDDLIVVDFGLQFPSDDMLGVDIVIPDIEYLRDNQDRIRGIFITHGHEDHIGALPYLVAELDVPIYATPLARGLISVKMREHRLTDRVDLRPLPYGEVVDAGVFQVEPFGVTHSIPDCAGLIIHTPIGAIVHSADFKFDATPVFNPTVDRDMLRALGRRGVLALLCDCVRVEKPGHTPSEAIVADAFDRIVRSRSGRVIIATFASNISRIQQAIDVARRTDRKVAVVGRSMVNNCAIATDLGFLHGEGTLVRIDEALRMSPERVLLMTTGSQGEPSSALSRMANNDHRQIRLMPGDTVILSATAIPGNEETVGHTIDNLMRQGADVIYEPLETVHVSGHGSQEDIKDLISLLQPRHCVPIHGEYRHMVLFRKLAEEVGIPRENVHLIDVGDVFEFGTDYAQKVDRVPTTSVLVEGSAVGATSDVVLRDRRHLSQDGILVVVVTIDRLTGELFADPEIIMRGIAKQAASGDLVTLVRQFVTDLLSRGPSREVEYGFVVRQIREEVGEFVWSQIRSHPVILPVVTEI